MNLLARDHRPLYVAIALATLTVLVLDLATPLGIAVWVLYCVPIAATLVQRRPAVPVILAATSTLLMAITFVTDEAGMSPWVAATNRVFGVAVIWVLGLISASLVASRARAERDDFLRSVESELLSTLQGELPMAEIGARTLTVLARALDAPVGVLFARRGNDLVPVATDGLSIGADVPDRIAPGQGVVGAALEKRRVVVVSSVPEGSFAIRSGLVAIPPSHLVVAPLVAEDVAHGAIELGLMAAPGELGLALLDRVRPGIAVAVRSAAYRQRLQELLEETQRQSEELQTQQEELRVSNEELEEQTKALQVTQSRLELQQAELEATNAELESQATALEQERSLSTDAQHRAEQASRYKSEFLANMSHELRTPLNSALILAKLLAENEGGRLSEEQVRFANTIHASGVDLLTLINDVLDLSKIEAGAIEIIADDVAPRALVATWERTFRPIAVQKGLQFSTEVAEHTPALVKTDAQRVQQIVTNLLSNAFKFTTKGGVKLTISRDGDQLLLAVSDTGPGIPSDKLDLIFEAFRQADGTTQRTHGGTGLGLSIARELSQLLGGDVRVASQLGAGSTFVLSIPLTPPAAPGRRPSTPSTHPRPRALPTAAMQVAPSTVPGAKDAFTDDRGSPRRSDRTILVVEDDPAFARILYDLVHELEFDCLVATSVDEGMALARDAGPSGVLLDLSLPDGSGLTLLDRLKRNPDTRHIPVHVVSATDHAHTAYALGAVGFALKPVARDALVAAIAKLEDRLEEKVRRVLVVEDDAVLRESTQALLRPAGVVVEGVGTAHEALERLRLESFDCVVLDLALPDATGIEVLETMASSEQYSFPPVIVNTGRDLSADEEQQLRTLSRSVIVKGARSPERLLDEVTLFLHRVESRLPPDARKLLARARERDVLFEGKTILVAEDDVRNVFALTSILEPRGARVVIARNGREAIEKVERERPHLVLMDIMMPEMDGLAAMRELRARPEHRRLPIIALTAKAMRSDHEACIEAGANDYMTKPLDVDKLVSLCRVWMTR